VGYNSSERSEFIEIKDLYRQILGMEGPWKVSEVELYITGEG